MPYLLVGNSVILKQDSIYYEHFYNELQPWKHYVPFKKDLSDLLEKIQWVKDHDAEVGYITFAWIIVDDSMAAFLCTYVFE